MRETIRSFMSDSLLRNAAYLFASTAIMAVLGFAFWVFVARLYPAAEIGVASALISMTLLIQNFSMLGLNASLIRYLPSSKHQSRDINAALLAVGAATALVGMVYLAVTHFFGPSLPWFGDRPWSWGLLLIILAAVSLNSLSDSVFIAQRKAQYHLYVYTVFGLTKLLLPLVLVTWAEMGVFMAYAGGVLVSLAVSLFFMVRACGYEVLSRPNWGILLDARRYAVGNYLSTLISGAPPQLMPTIILASLGAASSAYFALALTMASLLFIIPHSVSQSLLAESSHVRAEMGRHVRHAAKILTFSLVPIIGVTVALAHIVLGLFGPEYSRGSERVFELLTISTVFVAVNAVASTVLNLLHRPMTVVVVQLIIAVATLALTLLWLPFGLAGVGWAMLCGSALGSISYAGIFGVQKFKRA